MNKYRKNKPAMNLLETIVLLVSVLIVMSSGVFHAFLKNKHVQVLREIDKTQEKIRDEREAINSLQVKIDKKLNIYQLRDDLQRVDSALVSIPPQALIKMNSSSYQKIVSQRRSKHILASSRH